MRWPSSARPTPAAPPSENARSGPPASGRTRPTTPVAAAGACAGRAGARPGPEPPGDPVRAERPSVRQNPAADEPPVPPPPRRRDRHRRLRRGALPDAADYGDPPDANTIAHVAEAVGGLRPADARAARARVDRAGARASRPPPTPALHGRLHPLGPGKDSTTGHWELMGVVVDAPAADLSRTASRPTSSRGLEAARPGMRFCANRPADGARDHRRARRAPPRDRRGDPLHVGRLGPAARGPRRPACPRRSCTRRAQAAREVMRGEHAVGRVIARPFTGSRGALHAHRRPPRLLARAAAGARTSSSCRTRACRSTRSARSATSSPGVGIDRKHPATTNEDGARGDDRAAARARRPASSSRTSSRPTRSTATATTSRASRRRWSDRRRGRRLARRAPRPGRPADPHRRPRRRPDRRRTPTTRASTRR